MENIRQSTRRLTFLGIMLAITVVLSTLEHMLPPLPLLPPNVKPGLSNIVTMYCLFFMGKKEAFSITVLKALFVLLMRGVTAGFLSLCGGMFSIAVILLLFSLFRKKLSFIILSIFGAIAHNLGQMMAASVILKTNILLYYLPILIVSGVLMGSVTGILLRVVMPQFDGLRKRY